ncbi:MAG TPA: sigma-54 dependent transcriptional regulator [Rhodocyclaceae bacterium]|nr:sigma-54 dependent transcriptional regulator [Rhodocyclaceae bacterium]
MNNSLPRQSACATECSPLDAFIGESAAMRSLRASLERIARSDCNVLITGETGTGKECVAWGIHRLSRRAAARMVCINCAALPDALLESELFGHVKGAFTGASANYCGKIMLAGGGTLFLDEIGDMSPASQAKILRVIETREVFPVGATRSTQVDLRVIAATHHGLEHEVQESRFRADLFYRLNVARVDLPPLRERREDIPLLLAHFARELQPPEARRPLRLAPQAMAALTAYDWPGNCRELRNFVEVAYIHATEGFVAVSDLPDVISGAGAGAPSDAERTRIVSALVQCEWNRSEAARHLRWSRMTLYRKMKRYAITPVPPSAARRG